MNRLIMRLLVVIAAVGLVPMTGCGSDPPKKEEKKEEKKPGAAAPKGPPPKKGGRKRVVVMMAKPEWDTVRPKFEEFADGVRKASVADGGSLAAKDVFRNNAADFFAPAEETKIAADKPKVEQKKDVPVANNKPKNQKQADDLLSVLTPPDGGKKSGRDQKNTTPILTGAEKKTPLTALPLSSYAVRIIYWGVSVPVAVVETPDGKTYEIRREDMIGSEGAKVKDILSQRVLFEVPGRDQLVEASVAPEILTGLGVSGN